MDKSHMFTGAKYGDKTEVPRVTYRCKTSATESGKKGMTHLCKKVSDHPGSCVRICDVVVREA